MKIVVTGAGSFIGLAFADLCRQQGVEVVGLDAAADAAGRWHQVDIRSHDVADLIPQDADALVHLAALSRDPDCRNRAQACFDVNVMGTLNLAAAAKQKDARQFVFASSEWVYDSFEAGIEKTEDAAIDASRLASEYALSKYVSENNLRQQVIHGFCPVTILRFGIVYGPREKNWSAVEALLNAVATRDEIEIGARATARRFVHVVDVAAGIFAALGWSKAFDIFNIQGPALTSLGDIIDASGDILGRSPRLVETAPSTPSVRPVSNQKATRELGWAAAIDIREGLTGVARHLGFVAPA